MRYVTLAEAFGLAEAVTGIDARAVRPNCIKSPASRRQQAPGVVSVEDLADWIRIHATMVIE